MISLYFHHRDRYPHNVLLVWHNSPQAPAVGDRIQPYPSPDHDALWVVVEATWFNGGHSVDLLVADWQPPLDGAT